MNNILRLFRSDMRHLFRNVMSTIIVVGLVALPSLFAWYNILACWNVFENTGNLKVAVANADEGYESDLVPLRVNIGEQVVSALRGNDQIDWVFTSEEEAVDGARSGAYYAAVVIPKSFSRDMLTFFDDDAQSADIVYYTNEKKNAIAPKITDTGADSVSTQVNEVFVETLTDIALALADAFSNYAEDTGLTDRIGVVSDHVRHLGEEVDEGATVLALFGEVSASAGGLIDGASGLIDSAREGVEDIASATEDGLDSGDGMLGTVQASLSTVERGLRSSSEQFATIANSIDTILGAAETSKGQNIERLTELKATIDGKLLPLLEDDLLPLVERLGDQALIDQVSRAIDDLTKLSGAIGDLLKFLNDGGIVSDDAVAEMKRLLSSAAAQMASVADDFSSNVKPELETLAGSVALLASQVRAEIDSLDAAGGGLGDAATDAAFKLRQASDRIADAACSLRDTACDLRELADSIDAALAANDTEALKGILASDAHTLARALAAPVQVERIAVYPSENFGSSMAPLYSALALFIGSLLILVTMKTDVSRRAIKRLKDPEPHQLFLGRFCCMGVISLMQTTVMGLGNMLFLKVQVSDPLLFMVCFWVAGLVFTFIIYALVASFANLGKAIAVLLLIAQVTGCGGSFPLQLLPGFVQMISPWLPATHVVDAMRIAMFGGPASVFWVQMGELALFLMPAALLGLVLRKPLQRFMRWYVEQVESSKLIG